MFLLISLDSVCNSRAPSSVVKPQEEFSCQENCITGSRLSEWQSWNGGQNSSLLVALRIALNIIGFLILFQKAHSLFKKKKKVCPYVDCSNSLFLLHGKFNKVNTRAVVLILHQHLSLTSVLINMNSFASGSHLSTVAVCVKTIILVT